MLQRVRRAFTALCLLVACGGRTSLDGPALQDLDAAPPPPDTSYKIAFQETIVPGPALVWHSRDATTSPLGYSSIGPLTYDGKYMVVSDESHLTVLDRNAAVVRTQAFPQGVTPEVAWPRNDASRVVLTLSSGLNKTYATFDADGTYAIVGSGDVNYNYAKYAPDGVTLIFVSQHAIWSMRDDGSSLTQLATSDRDIGDVAFSYDQTRIAFTSYAYKGDTDTPNLSVLEIGGEPTDVPLPFGTDAVFQPSFVPDGSGVVFLGWRNDVSSVFFADASSQAVTTLVPNIGGGYQIEAAISVARDVIQ